MLTFEEVVQQATQTALATGEHMPLCVCQSAAEDLILLGLVDLAKSAAERHEQLILVGRTLCQDWSSKKTTLHSLFFISEAWQKILPLEHTQQDIEQAQAIEVLIICGAVITPAQEMFAIFEMVRDTDEKLIELKELGGALKKIENNILDSIKKGYLIEMMGKHSFLQ